MNPQDTSDESLRQELMTILRSQQTTSLAEPEIVQALEKLVRRSNFASRLELLQNLPASSRCPNCGAAHDSVGWKDTIAPMIATLTAQLSGTDSGDEERL